MKKLRTYVGFHIVGNVGDCIKDLRTAPILGKDRALGFGQWPTRELAEKALVAYQNGPGMICRCSNCHPDFFETFKNNH